MLVDFHFMIRFRVALSQDNIPLKCFFAIFKVISKEKRGKKYWETRIERTWAKGVVIQWPRGQNLASFWPPTYHSVRNWSTSQLLLELRIKFHAIPVLLFWSRALYTSVLPYCVWVQVYTKGFLLFLCFSKFPKLYFLVKFGKDGTFSIYIKPSPYSCLWLAFTFLFLETLYLRCGWQS